jgi:hypothetical protein
VHQLLHDDLRRFHLLRRNTNTLIGEQCIEELPELAVPTLHPVEIFLLDTGVDSPLADTGQVRAFFLVELDPN